MELAAVTTSHQDLLDEQKNLFQNQIEKLQQIVSTQCKLTGVNPLSQEMAAGALSIKIGKRPRDLLNPKAVKYMQLVFSMKDAISKRETREISAQFGVTVSQVRDFFNGQRSRVRKFIRLAREKANRSSTCNLVHDGITPISDPNVPAELIPLDTIAPINIDEGPSCSKRPEGLSGLPDPDIHFVEHIFGSMRKEETFFGQVKLLRWILQMKNPSVLNWFLAEGGLMILATWLGEAAKEEQTSFLLVILKLLDYLPLRDALPAHVSAILQSVNKLRFYRASDISHRARNLLSNLSKALKKSLSSKKNNGMTSASDSQDEMLLKQSISEVMANDSWGLKDDNPEEALRFLHDNADYPKKLETAQPLKMLTAAGDDSNKRRGVLPSHTRERRKVQMVEHPGQRSAVRSSQVARPTSATQSRPLSADDIQKAKMRAQFMQNKYGKTTTCPDEKIKSESESKCASLHASPVPVVSHASPVPVVSKSNVQTEVEEQRKLDECFTEVVNPHETSPVKEEPPSKRCKRMLIPWRIPPEVKISEAWCVATGGDSKEYEVQKNRIKREKEVTYRTIQEIPSGPREPWDREMDCDDSLTPEIPTEQLPDVEPLETPSVSINGSMNIVAPVASTSSENMPEPDLELLAALLKNPELVFALTSGGNLSSDETVKLLDRIKANGVSSLGNLAGNAADKVEVSLPSPTPSTEPVPNGLKPDFSRNPFSRQHSLANGNAYQAPVAMLPIHQQGMAQVPATTILTHQPSVQQYAHVAVQTSIQSPQQQWQPHTHSQIHHQSTSNIQQHLTMQMMLNANSVANFNRVPSNVPTTWNDPLGNVKPSQSITQPQHSYLQESNSVRARQGFEPNHLYQNNRTVNNYNAYAGAYVQAPSGRNNPVERPEFESWSPDNSPSKRHEYLPGQHQNMSNVNSRNGYNRHLQPSGYQDKRWPEYKR